MNMQGTHLIPHDFPVGIVWYSATYSIGQVLLHFFDFKGPVALEPGHVKEEGERFTFRINWAPGEWPQGLALIWPLPFRAAPWPPSKVFDDSGFQYLAKRWNHLHPSRQTEDQPRGRPQE